MSRDHEEIQTIGNLLNILINLQLLFIVNFDNKLTYN